MSLLSLLAITWPSMPAICFHVQVKEEQTVPSREGKPLEVGLTEQGRLTIAHRFCLTSMLIF